MGKRLCRERPKALVEFAGKPILVHTLERFAPLGLLGRSVVIVPPDCLGEFEAALAQAFPDNDFVYVKGGAERQISIWNGLDHLDAQTDIVVIHDAARPFVSGESVSASIAAARGCGAATVAIPSIDTVLIADEDQCLEATPDRRVLWACQTPQTFKVDVIRKAHERARTDGVAFADDASLVRRYGIRPRLVMGSRLNFKVTTPTDLALAECVALEGLA